ncbi:MAG: hypothetical protein IT208_10400 [Chthonomonadales bacterium]|nr:hypothetical protein [Chthonomonadales bacterium]
MKKRLVVLVTFLAGLYYLLEFLVPPRVGGAPDSAGAASATLLPAPGADALAYTGLRAGEAPRIVATPLGPGAGPRPRVVLLAPSFARRDDYRGALRPQFVPPERLYYVGLGWDDRTPRACLARLRGGAWRPLAHAVLDRGKPGDWDASGVTWVSVLPPAPGSRTWRMWYVGRRGSVGRVGLAESMDGVRWTKRGLAVGAPADESIESVSVERTAGGYDAWLVRTSTASPAGEAMAVSLGPEGAAPRGARRPLAWAGAARPSPVPVPGATLNDLRRIRAATAGEQGRFLFTYTASGGLPAVGLAADAGPGGALAVTAAPIVAAGPAPLQTHLSDARGTVDDIIVVVGSFAIGLGLVGLAQVHGKRVLGLRRGWPESLTFFAAAASMSGFTLYARLHPGASDWAQSTYDVLFKGMLQPLGAAMFSLLAAYLVSAAYRAFKVRSLEATLMAASATLIMLGQVPVGNWLTQSLPHGMQIPTIMAWVLFVANNAVVRAVNFGLFVGALATALRVWLSMDRASMRMFDG